jgi:hypothetical protein
VALVAALVELPADPSFGFGWIIYVRLSPSEQKTVIDAGIAFAGVSIGAVVCAPSAMGGPIAAALCAGAITAAGVVIWRTVDRHYHPTYWIELKFTHNMMFKGIGNGCWREVESLNRIRAALLVGLCVALLYVVVDVVLARFGHATPVWFFAILVFTGVLAPQCFHWFSGRRWQ